MYLKVGTYGYAISWHFPFFFLFSLLPFESYAYSILINNNKENVGHKVVYT